MSCCSIKNLEPLLIPNIPEIDLSEIGRATSYAWQVQFVGFIAWILNRDQCNGGLELSKVICA